MLNNESDEQIANMCRMLRPGNPLRRQAEVVLTNRLAPIDDVRPVVRAFKTWTGSRGKRGAVATWLVENAAWNKGQRDTITGELSVRVVKVILSRKPAAYTSRMLYSGTILSVVLCAGYVLFTTSEGGKLGRMGLFTASLIATAGVLLLGSIIAVPLSIFFDSLSSNSITRAVELLGKASDPRCLATLATALTHLPMRDAAATALKLIGSKVRPTDYGALPGQTVPSLCRALAKADNDTALVILSVLETIGDERANVAVAKKLEKTANFEVSEAALRALAAIRQRADESRTSGMLLRPSSAAPDAERMLLRAAHGQGDMHEEQLLRVDGD